MRFKPFHFPTHWKFEDPDTGTLFTAINKNALVNHIIAYRQQNQLEPIEHLDLVLENYLCGQPLNAGGCVPTKLSRGLVPFIRGGVALVRNLLTNRIVTQQEADRRARICISCSNNYFPDKDGFVKWSDEMAEIAVGKNRSMYHNELGNCGDGKVTGCGCPLRSKVFLSPPYTLEPQQEKQMRKVKPNCWQLPENLTT